VGFHTMSDALDVLEVVQVYEAVTGNSTAGQAKGAHVRVICPSAIHNDSEPSCDLSPAKNSWICRSCEAKGGVVDLPIAAGLAANRVESFTWLKEKFALESAKPKRTWRGKEIPEAVYPYHAENGNLLYEVCRYAAPKDFLQRRRDSLGNLVWNLDKVVRVPFHLPALKAAMLSKAVFVCEGEKDVLSLEAIGLTATTNSGGTGFPWDAAFAEHFRDALCVVVLPDCDDSGRTAAKKRAALLKGVAKQVLYVDLAPERADKYDVSDWIAEGHTAADLRELCRAAAQQPVPEPEPGKHYPSMAELVEAEYAALKKRIRGEGLEQVQYSPWPALNEAVGGWKPGNFVVWAAAPGIGKSGAANMLSDYLAAKHGHTILVSLEMSRAEVVQRLIAMYGTVSVRRQDAGDLQDHHWSAYEAAIKRLKASTLRILDNDENTLPQLHENLLALHAIEPIKAVVIDHVGEFSEAAAGRGGTVNDSMNKVLKDLRQIARDLPCVVHSIQHLNRTALAKDITTGDLIRPTMAMIRDGGNIEGIANTIIFPHRAKPWGTDQEQRNGEFIVIKNRNGSQGMSVPMRYHGWRHMWLAGKDDKAQPWFEENSVIKPVPPIEKPAEVCKNEESDDDFTSCPF
jgi:5S rRNA maturation endonuclease (ribonuclease M5)